MLQSEKQQNCAIFINEFDTSKGIFLAYFGHNMENNIGMEGK